MKKHTYAIEILVIFLVFILPPLLFSRPQGQVFKPVYGWMQYALFACGIGLFWYGRKTEEKSVNRKSDGDSGVVGAGSVDFAGGAPQYVPEIDSKVTGGKIFPSLFLIPACFLVSFGFLCLISSLVQAGAGLFGAGKTITVLPPAGFFEWSNFFIGTVLAAFFEEVLFRYFLPDRAEKLFEGKGRFLRFCWEYLVIFLFAESHRHAGSAAVANAFFSAIVLRVTFLKCRNVFVVTVSHALYNLMTLFFMMHTGV